MLSKKILLKRILPALLLTSLLISLLLMHLNKQQNIALQDADFKLTKFKGGQFTKGDLIGKPSIIFFGFLNCPDICPSSLQLLSNLIDDLGMSSNKINFYFVSVDPERDSPAMMRDYLGSFNSNIVGISGEKKELRKLYKVFGIYAKKVPIDKDNYTVDHTASLMVLNQSGLKVGELLHEDFSKFIVLDNFGKILEPKKQVKENLQNLLNIN